MAEQLAEVTVWGDRPGDPFFNQGDYDVAGVGPGAGPGAEYYGGGQTPPAVPAFVAPPLPELVVEALRPAPAPTLPLPFLAPLFETIAGAAAAVADAVLAPLLVFFPSPTGDSELRDEPMQDVFVTAPPAKPPAAIVHGEDFVDPPNWTDYLDFTRPLNLFTYVVGGALFDDRTSPLRYAPTLPKGPSTRVGPVRRVALPVGPAPIGDPLIDVYVTAPRDTPRPFTPLAPYLDPVAIPDYFGSPFADPFAEPIAAPTARPIAVPRPVADPIARPIGDPLTFAEPFSPTFTPTSPRTPTGSPVPFAPPPGDDPNNYPFSPIAPDLIEAPNFAPPDTGRCNCTKAPAKKKKKKKSSARDECFEYKTRQFTDGTRTYEKKLIACEPKSTWLPAKKGKPKTTTKNPFPSSTSLLGLSL